MRAVRYLLRIGGLALAGGAVFFGLVLLLNAQVLLNRYAELYMMDTAGSSAAAPTNNVSAHISAGVEPAREGRAQLPDPQLVPPIIPSEAGSGSSVQAPEPQATSPATMAESEGAAAILVSNADSIAGLEASDQRVDVVLTPHPAISTAVSEIVLENVRVLAIELVLAGIAERPPVHAVTLDVDAETTQNLLLASRAGKLSLALHRGGDNRRMAEVRESASPDVVGIPQVVTTPPVVDTPQQAVTTPPVVDTPQQAVTTPPVADTSQQAVTTTPVAEPLQQGAGTPQAVDIPQTVSQPPVAVQNRDPRFVVVTVHRFGGRSSTYKVPRER